MKPIPLEVFRNELVSALLVAEKNKADSLAITLLNLLEAYDDVYPPQGLVAVDGQALERMLELLGGN